MPRQHSSTQCPASPSPFPILPDEFLKRRWYVYLTLVGRHVDPSSSCHARLEGSARVTARQGWCVLEWRCIGASTGRQHAVRGGIAAWACINIASHPGWCANLPRTHERHRAGLGEAARCGERGAARRGAASRLVALHGPRLTSTSSRELPPTPPPRRQRDPAGAAEVLGRFRRRSGVPFHQVARVVRGPERNCGADQGASGPRQLQRP